MPRYIVAAMLLVACLAHGGDGQSTGFDSLFEDATLRVDFYQVGNAETEIVVLDRMIRQGRWAGPRERLADPFGLGRYAAELRDPETGATLFERGFDSYFGEYRTTKPAREGVQRSYHNSVLMPLPRQPVLLVITSRPSDGSPSELLRQQIDPTSVEIALERPTPGAVVVVAHEAGEPSDSLDVAIVGEGYSRAEEAAFREDLARMTEMLLGFEPYASHRDRIAVRGVLLPSLSSGIDQPTRGTFVSSSVGATFNSLGSERYLLTEDNRALRDIAANVPYDMLLIMVNEERYGGGGIYNAYCTFTAHGAWTGYLMLHELGHSFAGLADEYYSSDVAYNEFYPRGVEPAEPNITALLSPGGLKWSALVEEGTPIPTPWNKPSFDAASQAYQKQRNELNDQIAAASRSGAPPEEIAPLEEELELLSAEHTQQAATALASEPYSGRVGAFEGAGYASTGLYRPMLDCLMFRRGVQPFCRVCERAVADTIRYYTGEGAGE